MELVAGAIGDFSIAEGSITGTPPGAYTYFGREVTLTAPNAASAAEAHHVSFYLDASALPAGETVDDVQVFRNGAAIPSCANPQGVATVASPDPCVYLRTTVGNDAMVAVATTRASKWNFGIRTGPPEVVTLDAIPTKAYGDDGFLAWATSSLGSPITYSRAGYTTIISGGSIPCTVGPAGWIRITGAGTCTVTATGSEVSDTKTFVILRKAQTVTFAQPAARTYGTQSSTPLAATSSSGLAVTFTATGEACTISSTGVVTVVKAGTCSIKASQAGNDKFKPATAVTRTLTVSKATKNPTFPAIPPQLVGAGPITVAVAGNGSTSPVVLSSGSTSVCSVVSGRVRLLKVGLCTLTATQAADANHNAGSATKTFYIKYNVTQSVTMTGAGATRQADVRVSIFNFDKSQNLGASTVAITATRIDGGALPSQLAPPRDRFTFTAATKQYRLVFRTTGLAPGSHTLTYTVAGDPVPKTITFTV